MTLRTIFSFSSFSSYFVAVAALGLLLPCGTAQAEGIVWTASGFLTLGAGRIFGGDPYANFNGYQAPIYIADYGQAGIYQKSHGWSLEPDSKAGLQVTASFNPQWSLTTQAVMRGAANGRPDLEWLYASWRADDKLTLQFGRKRLPLFYYSESQDVGFSMPWVRLPPQAYGWDVVNYDGANLQYNDQWGNWSARLEAFLGGETRRHNPYLTIYYGKDAKLNETWNHILGADVTLSRDWLDLRFAYVQSDWSYSGSSPYLALPVVWPSSRQRIYSAGANVDYQGWVGIAEVSYLNRKAAYEYDYSQMLGIGHRFGKWLPMLTYANFSGHFIAGPVYAGTDNEANSTLALSLRYDLTASSDVKLQLERWKDKNGPNFNATTGVPTGQGNPVLLSISYDQVF
jgi:hypothetical protein